MWADLEDKGERIDDMDVLIAGSALAAGAVLVAGNLKHFSRIPGLEIQSF